MEEARSEIKILPVEVLLMVFRYLGFKDLQLAEQVCERWKAVVETRFATIKVLDLDFKINPEESERVKMLKRCGPSLQTLFMCKWHLRNKFNWTKYIAEAFPNLKTLSLQLLDIENEDLRTLSMKCSQLKSISFGSCTVSDEGLGLLLKGLPALQYLSIYGMFSTGELGECFSHLGWNLEYLSVSCWRKKCFSHLGDNLEYLSASCWDEFTTAGFSHLFSKCKKLKTLDLKGKLHCDDVFSNWCQENVSVQKLSIGYGPLTKLSFSQISRLSVLEELDLTACDSVDSDTLIDISQGCHNLRRLTLCNLRNICGRGVKSLSGCRNLSDFCCAECNGVTEESLVELGKSGTLKQMKLFGDRNITNSGCAAILGHCPQLEVLYVADCKGVVDGIVDIAIQAIENRANGVVLHLHIWDSGVDPRKGFRNHPLLRVH